MNRIKALRKQKGMTMKELADEIGTSQQQIDRLEKSHRRLTVDWMEKLSSALQCEVTDLIKEDNRDLSLTAKAKVVGEVKPSGKIDWFEPKDIYPLIFGRPKNLPGSRMFALYVGGAVKGFQEGSELIFCEIDKGRDVRPKKGKLCVCQSNKGKQASHYIEEAPTGKDATVKALLVKSIRNE